MTVILNDKEINQAVECYLVKNGLTLSNRKIDVSVVVGRTGNGNRIEVEIVEDSEVVGSVIQRVISEPIVKEPVEDNLFSGLSM